MFNSVEEISKKYNIFFGDFDDISNSRIIDIFNGVNIEEYEKKESTAITCALYYQHVLKDYNKMKKCYEKFVDEGDYDAINNMGLFYESVENKFTKAENMFLLSTIRGHPKGIINLIKFYQRNKKYKNMIKWCEATLKKCNDGNKDILWIIGCLAHHYSHIEINDNKKIEYIILFINYYKKSSENFQDYNNSFVSFVNILKKHYDNLSC